MISQPQAVTDVILEAVAAVDSRLAAGRRLGRGAVKDGRRFGTRPGWDGGLYAFMRRVLESDRGAGLYSKRQGMTEPDFAHTRRWRARRATAIVVQSLFTTEGR